MTSIIICPAGTNHPGDDIVWNPARVDTSLFTEAGNLLLVRPGAAYRLDQRICLGDGVTVKGANPIVMPVDQSIIPVADPASMAVFISGPATPDPKKNNLGGKTGGFRLEGCDKATLQDLFLQGYAGIDYLKATNCNTTRVCIDHKLGDAWAWFQQTGAFFQHGGSSGNTWTSCFARAQHHGFLNHDSSGGWIKNTLLRDFRALDCGCGKEPSEPANDPLYGTGYLDWAVGIDGAEQVDIDGLEIDHCRADHNGKVGIYFEPEDTGMSDRKSPYVRKNVYIHDCVCAYNGKYGGGMLGTMRIKEGEQCNYLVASGHLKNNISIEGAKVGYYARQEFNVDPLIYDNCIDIGSNRGFVLELAGASATYNDCIAYEPKVCGVQLMGAGPVRFTGKVQVSNGAEAFHLGGYLRVYDMESKDSNNTRLQQATAKEDWWPVKGLTINAQVAGNTRSTGYVIHPGTGVDVTRVNLTTIARFDEPVWGRSAVPPATDPVVIVTPPRIDPLPPVPVAGEQVSATRIVIWFSDGSCQEETIRAAA